MSSIRHRQFWSLRVQLFWAPFMSLVSMFGLHLYAKGLLLRIPDALHQMSPISVTFFWDSSAQNQELIPLFPVACCAGTIMIIMNNPSSGMSPFGRLRWQAGSRSLFQLKNQRVDIRSIPSVCWFLWYEVTAEQYSRESIRCGGKRRSAMVNLNRWAFQTRNNALNDALEKNV